MAVDIAGSPRPSFDLKSAQLPVVALWLKTTDAGIFAEELAQRWGDDPDFFDNDPVLIDLSHVQDEPEPIDFPAVLALLRQYRTLPVAVRGGSAAQMQAAHDVGLSAAPEVIAARAAEAPLAEPVAARPAKTRNKTSSAAAAPEQEPPAEPAAAQAEAVLAATAVHPSQQDKPSTDIMAAPAAEPMGIASVAVAEPQEANESMRLRPTMVLDKPLRSGQQVYARGSDLVVMAVVSFGAEVIADGNIHVYAPLRGRAIAGARGDSAARIFTTCMEPQLVSIAGIYRTTEVAIAKDILGKPAQVRLDGEKLLIERL